MRQAKRVFDEGQALLRRRNSATAGSGTGSGYLRRNAERGSASRVEQPSSCLFSSSSIAKMLNNYDMALTASASTNKKASGGGRTTARKTTRSTSSTSMRSRPQRRSSSGSGLSTASSTMSNGHQSCGVRFHTDGSHSNDLMGRASSASSLSSFDDRYDHLYSYSSNLDLFEHQLFKTAQHRSKVSSQQNPSNKTEAVNDTFDLTAETRLLMDRTSQLVGKKSDREWVI